MKKVCLLVWLLSWHCSADVFKCRSETGELMFTDRNCSDASAQNIQRLPTGRGNVPTGLSNNEQQALTEMKVRLQRQRSYRATLGQQKAHRNKEQKKIQKRNCRSASEGLLVIRKKRRRGYALTDLKSLNKKEADFRKIQKADC
ncbi:MAG: hypothetical protein HOC70_05360 [Gammaproteobacteria bacterium]|mgnify:CR=1 FL=1|nr:hypothetical protein [Gammaproteobacteria bacterium]MBT4492653.1 hypothetical protein [Gammaproteobacteria bacterium]